MRWKVGRNGILLQNSNLLHWICHKFLLLFLCSDSPKDQVQVNKLKILVCILHKKNFFFVFIYYYFAGLLRIQKWDNLYLKLYKCRVFTFQFDFISNLTWKQTQTNNGSIKYVKKLIKLWNYFGFKKRYWFQAFNFMSRNTQVTVGNVESYVAQLQ